MPLDIVLDKVLDQLCSPSNSSDIKASASNYQLPDNALDICFDSNTALSNENNHTSKLSQEIRNKNHSSPKFVPSIKRSILYEHLLKDIPSTSKKILSLNEKHAHVEQENGSLLKLDSDDDSHSIKKSASNCNLTVASHKDKTSINSDATNDGEVDAYNEKIMSEIMNLSTKSELSNEDDSAVPLNLSVKKPPPSCSNEGSKVPSKLLVNNLVASNHHQALANALLNQANAATSIIPQQKKRGRKPKALQNNDSVPLLNFPSVANNFLMPSQLSQNAHISSGRNSNSDTKPRKRGRPPTLSPPHNSMQPLAAHASNLGKANPSGAFTASYPFNLFNTPDVLSSWPGLNALTAAAAAAAAAAAGNPYSNSQNPFNIFNKLNSKDLNHFNLNLLNTNLFNNLKNLPIQENEVTNNQTNAKTSKLERRPPKEDVSQLVVLNSNENSDHKGSFAHKPHPNEKQLRIPLNHGWKRVTFIGRITKMAAIEGEVNYFAPCGKKIRNNPELLKYLTKNAITSMTRDNFSFDTNVIVGQFAESYQDYVNESFLNENQMKAQLEEITKIRNLDAPSSNHVQSSSILPEKRRRVRDSGGTRNVYDNLKNLKPPLNNNKSIFQPSSSKKGHEPSITITVQNHSSRGSKRKTLEQSKADYLRNEKLLKKQEEERQLRELKEKQEEERKLKEAQERQLELQKQEELKLQAEIERERINQHQMFIQALTELQVSEEREAKKEEIVQEKIALQERKLIKKNFEIELMKELKKPIEDMMLNDLKDLPTFNRIPGLKLTGKAFADSLMVFEFLYNFGETIGFDTESLPNLNTLMTALLNLDKDAEEELMSIIIHLVVCAIEDPGLPTNVTTAMGQKLKDATVTVHNLTEILRLYFYSFDSLVHENDRHKRVECKIYDELCNGIPFLAMNASCKLDILVFLSNELLCNQAIIKQIEDNIESVTSFKKDKWLLENDIRKLRVVKMRRERITELENAKLKESSENCEETADSDTEETSSTTVVASTSASQDFEDDFSMTNEEIDKKVDKLNKQCNNMNNKLNKALNSYRVFPLGQDRYRRTYWLLPNCGGVFVEAMESGEPYELVNNIEQFSELDSVQSKDQSEDFELQEDKLNELQEKDIDNPDDKQIESKICEENDPSADSEVKDIKDLPEKTIDHCAAKGLPDSEKEQDDTKVDITNVKWFDLFDTCCVSKSENDLCKEENSDDEEKADDDSFEAKLSDRSSIFYQQLERGLKTFLDEQTMNCLFGCADKNADSAILKDYLIRMLASFPKSASITKFVHSEVSESEVVVCPNLQKRIQLWKSVQHDIPLTIGREFQLGWWRITDPTQLKSLTELFHSNALRERNLLKHLDKHLYFAMQSCKSVTANLEVNDFDREISESREYGAPTENKCPHKPCHSRGYCLDVTLSKDLQILELIEAFEEKMLASSMQIRNWKPSIKTSSAEFRTKLTFLPNGNSWSKAKVKSMKKKQKNVDMLKESFESESIENGIVNDNSNTSLNNGEETADEDLLTVEREKLLEIESGIERRYLKPPLGFKNQIMNSANSDLPNGEDYSEYACDENVPAGLLRWRDAVRDAKCSSQVAMCLHFLENCIAWDKSVMRASCQFCGSGENEAQLLLCDLCDKGYHMYCFKPKMENVPAGDWFCFDCQNKNTIDKVCIVCGKKGKLLNCDTCAKAFHPNCLDPPMTKPLKGRWICHLCQRKNKRYSNNSTKAAKKLTSSSNFDEKNAESPNSNINNHKDCKRVSNGNKDKPDKAAKKERKSKTKEEKEKCKEKNKDESIENETNNEVDLCRLLMEEMEKHESCWPFLEPVNTKQFPTYKKIIKKPIDLANIRLKFGANLYTSKEDFAADVRLMLDNCVTFNEDTSPVGEAGHALRAFFELRWLEMFDTFAFCTV